MGIIIAGGVTGLSWTMRKIKVESNIKDMNLVAVDIFSEPVNFARTNIDQGIVFRGMNSSEQTATKTAEDMFAVSMSGLDLSVCEDMFEQARHYEMIHESTFTQADICANGRAVFYYQLDSHVTDNQGCGYGMVWDETAGMCCRSLTLPESNECRIYTMVNASAGVCPDYRQTNLSGPCGTNGYCNNGVCVSCPASTESCSIDADEYDPATQCLMTKKVVCGENEVCEGDICVCAEGYELYEGVCLEACEGSGMTGLRDENGNCLCLEGTNAETCACPAGYIYLDGACQRFECRGTTNFYCYINDLLCGYSCNSIGKNCALGVCYSEDCPEDSIFVKLQTRHQAGYAYGCQKGRYEAMSQFFAYDGVWCCRKDISFDFDGPCTTGICEGDYDCSQYGAIKGYLYYNQYQGCIFNSGTLNEYRCAYHSASGKWDCYKDEVFCGTGCADPANCGTCGMICNFEATYNASTNMCEKDGVSCTLTSPMTCYRGDKQCGKQAPANQSEFAQTSLGNCWDPGCSALGMTYGYIQSVDYWGCISSDGMLSCYQSGNMPPINCQYEGKGLCAAYCQGYDASDCDAIFFEECAPIDEETGKRICPFDKTTTETCVCTTNRNAAVGTLCCPPGDYYNVNGRCTLVTCPEGQEPDGNGICREL